MTYPSSGDRLMKLAEVKQKTGLSSSTIYKRIGEGRFPTPLALAPNAVRWRESEIDAWINSLPLAPCGRQTQQPAA